MAINFSNAIGIHERALSLRSQRSEVLANNIANADTPGYKAKDIDFKEILRNTSESMESMRTTNSSHISDAYDEFGSAELKFKNPLQPSVDGNTVEVHEEKAEFLKNALQFQASFRFLNEKMKGIKAALRSE
jgi:flagellar basal-body rod protein FlgB